MNSAMRASAPEHERFRHEALFYEGDESFVDALLPFLRGGVDAGDPMLVALAPSKVERLRAALGADASAVRFVDMPTLGRNPGRIIPEWRSFVDAHGGRFVRGIGEPIWAGRTEDELAECHLHEGLLNTAFEDGSPWWLVCPYDVTALAPEVVATARTTHPVLRTGDAAFPSATYAGADPTGWARLELADPGRPPQVEMTFGLDHLADIRRTTAQAALGVGLTRDRREALVLCINELATNSLKYGGGVGTLRIWSEGRALVCEVRDAGAFDDPLIGRERPSPVQIGRRGIWLVHQLCDLVQIRSFPGGTAVRVRMEASGS